MEARSNLLTSLEESIASQSAEEDIAKFISHAKQSEHTHKYAHALQLLDLQMERLRWGHYFVQVSIVYVLTDINNAL